MASFYNMTELVDSLAADFYAPVNGDPVSRAREKVSHKEERCRMAMLRTAVQNLKHEKFTASLNSLDFDARLAEAEIE